MLLVLCPPPPCFRNELSHHDKFVWGEKGASNVRNSTHQLKDDVRQCLSTERHGARAESAVQIWDSSTQQCQTCGWELPIFFPSFFFFFCNKQTIPDCDKDQIPLASSSFLPASVQSVPLASSLPLLPPASACGRTAFQPENNNHPSTSLIFFYYYYHYYYYHFFLQTVS